MSSPSNGGKRGSKQIRFADNTKSSSMATGGLMRKSTLGSESKRTKAILSDEHEHT